MPSEDQSDPDLGLPEWEGPSPGLKREGLDREYQPASKEQREEALKILDKVRKDMKPIWQITSVNYTGEQHHVLVRLLDDGWEPYSVSVDPHDHTLTHYLRRLKSSK